MLLQGFGRHPLGHGKALEVISFRYCPPVGFPSWKNLLTQSFFLSSTGDTNYPGDACLSLNRHISPIWLGPHSSPYLAIA